MTAVFSIIKNVAEFCPRSPQDALYAGTGRPRNAGRAALPPENKDIGVCKMKKLLAIALSLLMVLALAACGGAPAGEPAAEGSYEIAMITDIGNIDDKSFNQGTWEGCKEYAEANGNITHELLMVIYRKEGNLNKVILVP